MAEGMETPTEVMTEENPFMKKYLSLRNKCEHLQQGNEKLVNRLHHVKKLVKRYKRERRFLQNRLVTHGDDYKEAQVPVMWEEDQMYNLLKPPPASPQNKDVPTVIPVTTPLTKPKTQRKIKTLIKSHDQSLANSSAAVGSHDQLSQLYLAHGIKQEDVPMAASQIKQEPDSQPRPTNAFLMFCDQYKQSIQYEFLRERNEKIPQAELTKRLAMKWNTLPPDDKKVYYDMFEIEKRSYQSEAQTASTLESESIMAAMQLESEAAVTSLLMKKEPL